jgi:CRP-like cAMP-binding protein
LGFAAFGAAAGVAIRKTSNPQFPNRVLAALPRKASRRFLAALTPVDLAFGQVLYEPGAKSRHMYFPADSMVSLLAVTERGGGLEVGLVGRESMVGVALALGVSKSPVRAIVQGAGSALRISAAHFGRELAHSRPLRRQVDRCAYLAMATAMQVAVCNKAHVLEARLARWLLMTQDRVAADKFRFTQQFIALMLGVRRAGVNGAAGALQRRKLIRYSRGTMQILDREGLLAVSCTCYQVIRKLESS